MLYLFSSFLSFLLTLIIHIVISRIMAKRHQKSLKTLFVYLLGLGLHLWFCVSIIQPISVNQKGFIFLPLCFTSVVLYILFFCSFVVYYLSTYSNEVGPSVQIYLLMRKYKKRTLSQILQTFSDEELIYKRLTALKNGGFIHYKNNRYTILPKGIALSKLLNFYRALTRWESSG